MSCLALAHPVDALVARQDESSYSTKTRVPCYVWSDDTYKEPKAIFIAVHGAAQEGSVMGVLATDLAKRGYLVIAPDVRGNGRWKFTSAESTPTTLSLLQSADDVKLILAMVHEQFPNQHVYMLGESIGAGIVMKATDETPYHVSGLILCSAGVQPHMHNPLNLGTGFLKGVAHLVEPVDLSAYLTRYSSEDNRVTKEMVDNPLARNHQTGLELIGTFNFLMQETSFAEKVPADVPVLVIQGEEDQIIEPSSCLKILLALQSHDKQRVMVPKTGHVLVGSSFVKPQVMSCIDDWLKKHGGPKGIDSKAPEGKVAETKTTIPKPNAPKDLKSSSAKPLPGKTAATKKLSSKGTEPKASGTTQQASSGDGQSSLSAPNESPTSATGSIDDSSKDASSPSASDSLSTGGASLKSTSDNPLGDQSPIESVPENKNHLPRVSPPVLPENDPGKATIQTNSSK